MSETVAPSPVTAKAGSLAPTLVMSSIALLPGVVSAAGSVSAPASLVTNGVVVHLDLGARLPPAWSLRERAGVHQVERWALEDGAGHWLFEDGSAIVLGLGLEGTKLNLAERLLGLTVDARCC